MLSSRQTITSTLWPFFAILALYWAFLTYIVGVHGYHGAFAALNPYHHASTDYLSLYFLTHLGDGIILPGLLLLWVGRKEPGLAVAGVIGVLLTGLLVQILKRQVFPEWDRPPVIFDGDEIVRIFHPSPPTRNSFPSGHAASMVSGGLIFAIYMGKSRKWLSFAVGLFTAALSYTRVVLGAHFPGDVIVGGLIGGLGGVALLWWTWPAMNRFIAKFSDEKFANIRIIVGILAVLGILGQFLYQIFIRI